MSTKPGSIPKYLGFDHIHLWVGNALQAATFYTARFGFAPIAFRGLETGRRDICTHVVGLGDIRIALSSPLEPGNAVMGAHASRHGDSVRDVALRVTDATFAFEFAVARGAVPVVVPERLEDAAGFVVLASVEAPYSGVVHTFVERAGYQGVFLPGFEAVEGADPLVVAFPEVPLDFIDHCVCNQPDGAMNSIVDWYTRTFGFRRFWSVDDSQVHTKYSSLRSVVVADADNLVKMPVNEPAPGIRKSQIEEFIEYNGGPGIQHVALNSSDIVRAVAALRERGVRFLTVPATYYEDMRRRLGESVTKVTEDLDTLQRLGILVDFDETGYLLQIFAKPVQDRPTLFFEVIQRHHHEGFGVGNFRSLFEAIEREQALRGNL